jgi:hypothetical protein
MRPLFVPLATFLALLPACGRDEILEHAEKAAAAGAAPAPPDAPPPTTAGASPDPAAGQGAGIPEPPQPGIPAEPSDGAPPDVDRRPDGTGVPASPSPAPPGTPGGGNGQPGGGDGAPPVGGTPMLSGPTVTVTGAVGFDGYRGGAVRVTAFDGDHSARGAKPPRVLGVADLSAPGPYTLRLPANSGKVWIEATIDEDGNGRPGPLDPQGPADRFPVTVSDADLSGLDVRVQRRAPPSGAGTESF